MKIDDLRMTVKRLMIENGLILASGETIAAKASGKVRNAINRRVCWACLQNDFLSMQLN